MPRRALHLGDWVVLRYHHEGGSRGQVTRVIVRHGIGIYAVQLLPHGGTDLFLGDHLRRVHELELIAAEAPDATT